MQLIPTEIPAVKILETRKYGDHRGFFSEIYSRKALRDLGVDLEFVQDNHSLSARERRRPRAALSGRPDGAGQARPRGARRDPRCGGRYPQILADVRQARVGRHQCRQLAADSRPHRLRSRLRHARREHGSASTRSPTTILPRTSAGIRWNDPALGIDWGIDASMAILSDRDTQTSASEGRDGPVLSGTGHPPVIFL